MTNFLLRSGLGCWVVTGFLLLPGAAGVRAQTIAYTDVTIETLTETGRLDRGTLLVKDDKIVAVGSDLAIPDEARIVSLAGRTIIPGIVDPYVIFRRAPQPAAETETVSFRGRSFQIPRERGFSLGSFETISQYFYPQTFDFSRYIRSGVTTANLVSDGRGMSAYANLTTDPTPEMLFQEKGLLYCRVTNETAALDAIRNPLNPRPARPAGTGATNRSGETARTEGEVAGNRGGDAPGRATPSAASEATGGTPGSGEDYWKEIREGNKPLIVNSNNAAAVAHLLAILQKHPKVKVMLVTTGPNVYQALDRIQGTNITLVLKPEIATEPFSARKINVAKMAADRNIEFSFSLSISGSQLDGSIDEPLYPLAELVKSGLDRTIALKALSATPARLLGIEETHGTIAPGKLANFLVFQGDPLATGNRLEQVIVKGRPIHEN